MVASTVCSSNGFTDTRLSAEVVIGETAAFEDVEVVMGRAKEDVIDFYAVVRTVYGGVQGRNSLCSGQAAQSAVSTAGSIAARRPAAAPISLRSPWRAVMC